MHWMSCINHITLHLPRNENDDLIDRCVIWNCETEWRRPIFPKITTGYDAWSARRLRMETFVACWSRSLFTNRTPFCRPTNIVKAL